MYVDVVAITFSAGGCSSLVVGQVSQRSPTTTTTHDHPVFIFSQPMGSEINKYIHEKDIPLKKNIKPPKF